MNLKRIRPKNDKEGLSIIFNYQRLSNAYWTKSYKNIRDIRLTKQREIFLNKLYFILGLGSNWKVGLMKLEVIIAFLT